MKELLTDDKLIGWLAALVIILVLGLTSHLEGAACASALVGVSGAFGGAGVLKRVIGKNGPVR